MAMNQSPSNWVGTGPSGGGLGAADGVARLAEELDSPHAAARKMSAMQSTVGLL
jgi:hypothetical protein